MGISRLTGPGRLEWTARDFTLDSTSEQELVTLPGGCCLDVYLQPMPATGSAPPPQSGVVQAYARGDRTRVLIAQAEVAFPGVGGRVLRVRDRFPPSWQVVLLGRVLATPRVVWNVLATSYGESCSLPPVYRRRTVALPVQTTFLASAPASLGYAQVTWDISAPGPAYVGVYDTDPSAPVHNDSTLLARWYLLPGGSAVFHPPAVLSGQRGLSLFAALSLAHAPAGAFAWGQFELDSSQQEF